MDARGKVLLIHVFAFWCAGCTLFDDSLTVMKDPRLGRIIVPQSIDSLMPAFTTTEVERYRGEPEAIALGDYAGQTYLYGQGSRSSPPAEMAVLFAEDFGDRAVEITVNPPYPGKTKEGVGLGSRKDEVRWFFGIPDADHVLVSWMSLGQRQYKGDVYLGRDSTAMVFQYDSTDSVRRISLVRLSIVWL
jgi:hypothetical protein